MTNMSSQMKKGIIEYCVLAVIAGRGYSYGYEIVRELSELGLAAQEGTMYPLLARLKKENLLESTWRQEGAGTPRKYYRLTPRGQGELCRFRAEWSDFCAAVNRVLREANQCE